MPALIRNLVRVLAGVLMLSTVLVIGDATVASAAPVVTSVSPNSGPASGGTAITITGTGFTPGARVRIGQGDGLVMPIAATNAVVVSPTEITATTGGPAIAGTFKVFVTQNGGIRTLEPVPSSPIPPSERPRPSPMSVQRPAQ